LQETPPAAAKGKKEGYGDTPCPGKGLPPSALLLLLHCKQTGKERKALRQAANQAKNAWRKLTTTTEAGIVVVAVLAEERF